MQTIIVAGGDLFHIAAKQLNDATQWIRIAQLNNISDPVLSGLDDLAYPRLKSNRGGRHCQAVVCAPQAS